MKKKILLLSVISIAIMVCSGLSIGYFIFLKEINLPVESKIRIVPTMSDQLSSDSSWCGTFQLVWNDLKNEIANQEIVFNPQLNIVENLNKEEFTEDMLSKDSYYKVYGEKSLELKETIETNIKRKFNQTSDVLKEINWDVSNSSQTLNYILYTMLYKKFEFVYKFDVLNNDNFKNYKNISYFGIDASTSSKVGSQIDVLFYDSQDSFAIKINTKENDEIIFYKKPRGKTFNEIYENMNKKAEKYQGDTKFLKQDEFKAPNLKIDIKKEYSELTNKLFNINFYHNNILYTDAMIDKAIQTIQFELDNTGGEIKSEAIIDVAIIGSAIPEEETEEPKPRYFYVDDTFVIFLKEKGKNLPYFAARIDDVTKFQ